MEQKKTQRRKPFQKLTTRKTTRKKKAKPASHKLARWVCICLVCLFLILVVSILTGEKGHKGIDVSHHQGSIDWEVVAQKGGVEFAYIKATEGSDYVDHLYNRNIAEARKHGIAAGPYHFFRADKTGEEQFCNFQSVIGEEFDLIPVLDLEALGGNIPNRAAYRAEVKSFISLFEIYYGYRPIVYGCHEFIKYYVYPEVRDCDYWLAWYTPMAKVVRDKRRFLNKLRPGIHPRLWQYSDNGKIPGIRKEVDLDVCWELEDIKVK